MTDEFDDRYLLGVPDELPEEAPSVERRAARTTAAAPSKPFALRGCVITPTERLDDGYVVVDGSTIASVGTAKPDGVAVLDTEGVILPGLIDLHGHPEFNVFAAWEPPKRYDNRYAWRSDDLDHKLVRDPQKAAKVLPENATRRHVRIAWPSRSTVIRSATRTTSSRCCER